MNINLLIANKVICTKDLVEENGVVLSKKGDVWENTLYGTTKSVRLVREMKNGTPEWLEVSHDSLMEHFEEYNSLLGQ